VRVYSIASGGLTFIVAFVGTFCIVTWVVVTHFRKRQHGHHRLRNDSNIERLLREAFNSDGGENGAAAGFVRMSSVSSASTAG
jgi:hypothetical protein